MKKLIYLMSIFSLFIITGCVNDEPVVTQIKDEFIINVPASISHNYNVESLYGKRNYQVTKVKSAVDITKAGSYEVLVTVVDNKNVEYNFNYIVIVVDEVAPVIQLSQYAQNAIQDYLYFALNSKPNIKKLISVSDNSDTENTKGSVITIEPEIDTSKIGEGSFNLVVTDSSGNQSVELFNYMVLEKAPVYNIEEIIGYFNKQEGCNFTYEVNEIYKTYEVYEDVPKCTLVTAHNEEYDLPVIEREIRFNILEQTVTTRHQKLDEEVDSTTLTFYFNSDLSFSEVTSFRCIDNIGCGYFPLERSGFEKHIYEYGVIYSKLNHFLNHNGMGQDGKNLFFYN